MNWKTAPTQSERINDRYNTTIYFDRDYCCRRGKAGQRFFFPSFFHFVFYTSVVRIRQLANRFDGDVHPDGARDENFNFPNRSTARGETRIIILYRGAPLFVVTYIIFIVRII